VVGVGFPYTEPELRLPLHRMVFNFLSQIYYINGCPPTFYGLPFPSLIVEFPIYLFYLVSFNTEQASITMDINTRIVSIQQVMSSFAHMCPKNSTLQLSSAENFHTWEAGIQSILVPYGLGLWEFFVDGSLLVPTDGSIDELTVTQLSSYLNRALQVVLITTVDAEIIANFQCEGLSGFELLQAIRRNFSTLSATFQDGWHFHAGSCYATIPSTEGS